MRANIVLLIEDSEFATKVVFIVGGSVQPMSIQLDIIGCTKDKLNF